MTKFKVFDSKLKSFLSEEFYMLDCNGKLHYQGNKEVVSEWIFPVFSTGKTDKNGVELDIGDRMRNKNGHEFTLKDSIEGLETCEKIGSKYKEK